MRKGEAGPRANALMEFVKMVSGAKELTLAEGMEFLALIAKEANALRPFFVVESPEKPISQERTELRFST